LFVLASGLFSAFPYQLIPRLRLQNVEATRADLHNSKSLMPPSCDHIWSKKHSLILQASETRGGPSLVQLRTPTFFVRRLKVTSIVANHNLVETRSALACISLPVQFQNSLPVRFQCLVMTSFSWYLGVPVYLCPSVNGFSCALFRTQI
jgi:hypothetical protein